MSVAPNVSELRIEKGRSRAALTLTTGETVSGCFFVSTHGIRVPGPERIADLLNAEPGFFLFEIHDQRGVRTVLFNRSHIVTIRAAEAEARRDPGYEVATERIVSIRLDSDVEIVGSIRIHMPEGHNRLSDWARHPDQFRYVEAGEDTVIVNVAHVIEITEIAS